MRLAIVSGICVERDAISAAVAAQAELAGEIDSVTSVDVFVEHLDRDIAGDVHVVRDPWELLTHPVFQRADVAVFHFGIRYTIFDAMVGLDSARTQPIVHFHNVTPMSLVPRPEREVAEHSRRQIAASTGLDPDFWTYSEFNRRTLLAWGVAEERLQFVPFPIEPPRPLRPTGGGDEFRLVAVGRLVPAKGIHTILRAVASARSRVAKPIGLTLVGNPEFSDPAYIRGLEQIITDEDLSECVNVVADADDEALWSTYEKADVVVSGSLHEGLCVPVIEGYLAGCRVVGTDGGNLPYIIQPPDPVVPSEDVDAMAEAIVTVAAEIEDSPMTRRDETRELCLRYSRAATREAMRRALDERLAVGASA